MYTCNSLRNKDETIVVRIELEYIARKQQPKHPLLVVNDAASVLCIYFKIINRLSSPLFPLHLIVKKCTGHMT